MGVGVGFGVPLVVEVTLGLVVAVALIGGAGAWYFKIYRPKKQAAQPEEEYEEPDYSAYADEDDARDEEESV